MSTLFLTGRGTITKQDEGLAIIRQGASVAYYPIIAISDVIILGNGQITTPALGLLFEHNIPVLYATMAGKIKGYSSPYLNLNSQLRLMQYEAYLDGGFRLAIAQNICRLKIQSQIDMIKAEKKKDKQLLCNLTALKERVGGCSGIEQVMGIEARASVLCFNRLSQFTSFSQRSRRPAMDPFNALLNLTYMLMTHRLNLRLLAKGLDPAVSFLHSVRSNRQSLALDLVEPFRAGADKLVATITNRGQIKAQDFAVGDTGGYSLLPDAFKRYMELLNKHLEEAEFDRKSEDLCNALAAAIKHKEAAFFG